MATISIFVGSVYGGAERLSEQVIEVIEKSEHQAQLVENGTVDGGERSRSSCSKVRGWRREKMRKLVADTSQF